MFLYLAGAAVLRARRVAPSLFGSAILGLILALGCLAKAVLLPVGVVFVAVYALGLGSIRKAAVHVVAAGIVFLVIFGGFVAAMSARAGRVTLGDVSRLNYLWLVDGVRDHGWETDDPRLGTAIHPPRRLTSDPAVYEFAEPIAGTYPLWNDPPYWTEGLTWALRPRTAGVRRGQEPWRILRCADLQRGAAHRRRRAAASGSVDGRRRIASGRVVGAAPGAGGRVSPAGAEPRGVRTLPPRRGGAALPGRVLGPIRDGFTPLSPMPRGEGTGPAPLGLGGDGGARRGADVVVCRPGSGPRRGGGGAARGMAGRGGVAAAGRPGGRPGGTYRRLLRLQLGAGGSL